MENKTKKRQLVITGLLLGALATTMGLVRAQNGAASGNGQSLPEVIEAIEKARVTTRILYVTAHPDDEPGAVLSYLARGLHADVALLSLTRGEGGQNALGPEQAPQLGVLRTEELMNATRVYGTRLFFTRAADFGYTKSPDEALKVWGDETLEDMVRVIRTFRPTVIINNWGGVRGGHGQHVASGLLTPQAYAMAGDAKAFPKLLKEDLLPWKAEALLQLSRGTAPADGFAIPVSEISPLWGKSWGEIGVEGYLNHRTQGVGGVRSSPFFRRAITLVKVEGAEPSQGLLARTLAASVPEDERWRELADKVDRALIASRDAVLRMDWRSAVQAVAEAAEKRKELAEDLLIRSVWEISRLGTEIERTQSQVDSLLAIVAGIRVDAQAERSEVVTGESFTVTVNWIKRNDVPVEIEGASLALPEGWSVTKEEKLQTGGVKFTVAIPKGATEEGRKGGKEEGLNTETQRAQRNTEKTANTEAQREQRDAEKTSNTEAQRAQRSTEKELETRNSKIENRADKGGWIYPWPGALVKARLKAKVGEHAFETETEVTATRVTSVSAETRPLLLVPAVTLTLEPKEIVVVSGGNQKSEIRNQKQTEREIVVRVRHYATAAEKITVGIEAPQGWAVTSPNGIAEGSFGPTKGVGPQDDEKRQGGAYAPHSTGAGLKAAPTEKSVEQTVEFTGAGDQLVRFTVRAPAKIAAGKYELKAWAKRADGEEFRTSLEPLATLPARMWSEPSIARVHVMDVAVPKDLRVGYVTAENDPIPQALREIGVRVELLDEAALAFGELTKYDAICIGIRAYELRSDLARANQRLLDYAAAGGTLVVQYQREGVWNAQKPAPYPATASGQRTTDENSPVRVLEPSHPLLNFPNVMRIEDYSGWVQERGLYYWSTFDAKYTPVLAMKDPGEQEALGALVYAKHGKGVYIYTGLSFFRQLPEGVPGAYRLFANLLSQGRRKME